MEGVPSDRLVRKSHSEEVEFQVRPAQNERMSGTACREEHSSQREQRVGRLCGGAGSVCVQTNQKISGA